MLYVFQFLINTAFKVCSEENLVWGEKFYKIKLITYNNVYHVNLINKLIRKFMNKNNTNAIGNKIDSEFNIKKVVSNYNFFFQFMKNL